MGILSHGRAAKAFEIVLDRPEVALHVPPMVWTTQYKYSPDAVLLGTVMGSPI